MLNFPLFFYITCAKHYTPEELKALREDLAEKQKTEQLIVDHPLHHMNAVVDKMIVVALKEEDTADWCRYKLISNKNDKYVLGEIEKSLEFNVNAWNFEITNAMSALCYTNGLRMVGAFTDPTIVALPLGLEKES